MSEISYSGPLGKFIKSVRRYKKLDGYNYLVSDCGRVFSLKCAGKEMKIFTDRDGYKLVSLRCDRKTRQFKVHRLVLSVFEGGGEGLECNHINGVKGDNRVENLEWCTHTENIRHSVRIGLKGKLKSDAIKAAKEQEKRSLIFACHAGGMALCEIARKCNVSTREALRILKSSNVEAKNILVA